LSDGRSTGGSVPNLFTPVFRAVTFAVAPAPTIDGMRKIVALVLLTLAVSVTAQDREDRLTIDSKIMGEKRTVIVRVPATYQTGQRRYPVLYLTDGEAHIGHTAATAAYLAREGRMPEVILVAVVNTDRNRDLTPTKVADRPGETGGADRFLDFFEKELIPTIESRYRTQKFRVFAGHSLGGLFALHALFSRPELFDAWIAVSPSLQWDDRYLFRRANEFFAKPKLRETSVVVTVGDEGDDSRKNFEDFKKLVSKRAPKQFDALFVHFPDEDHGSVVMPSHYAGLRKVFAPWRFVIVDGADPKTELMRAEEHFARLSARAGYEMPVPENLTNTIGYLLLRANRTIEAIAVFQTNARNWPKSANVHDSLGEAYEKAGQRAEARASYERAAEIGAETNDPNLPIYLNNAERLRKNVERLR
jgi:predicted alpha/beta superfamily hydrolase